MSTLARNKITPFLWFADQAEQAVAFYTSLFRHSRVGTVLRYGPAGPGPEGSVMTIDFELEGQAFTALNGGPVFSFDPAISFVVHCEDQAEVDHYWHGLLEGGGQENQCGWLADRYGVSWQVVPAVLLRMLQDADAARVQRVTAAMLQMRKLDVAAFERAYRGD